MDINYLIGRILFSLIFIMSGMGHFMQMNAMGQYAAAKGVPAPKASVGLSGLMLLIGGLSVLLGVWMEVGTWLLVFFLLAAAFMVHNFWAVADPMEKQNEQAHFMKNLVLAGAAIALYWTIQVHGYGPYTLGSPMG